tara:strand:+ start:585 stop:911 length:327 start_codon:yes stop_codon:yes gene_type:complete
MIELYLGIGSGDIEVISFEDEKELRLYLKEIRKRKFNGVWLASSGNDNGEIYIHESLLLIDCLIADQYLISNDLGCRKIHLHLYDTFEDAYNVALYMREGNPLCYRED